MRERSAFFLGLNRNSRRRNSSVCVYNVGRSLSRSRVAVAAAAFADEVEDERSAASAVHSFVAARTDAKLLPEVAWGSFSFSVKVLVTQVPLSMQSWKSALAQPFKASFCSSL